MLKNEELIRELKKKLTIEISEKEHLQELNKWVNDQIVRFRALYVGAVEYASSIENDMEKRIEQITNRTDKVHEDDCQDISEIKEKLAFQIAINEKLQEENLHLKEESESLRIIHINALEHSTILENDLTEKYDEANRLAMTDNLTGIYNRLKFNQTLLLEIEKVKKKGSVPELIMFDIDHFKKINDNYGHIAGDNVLIKIAQIVNRIIRKRDTFARWGGEEFIILLPETGRKESSAIAERIRVGIENYKFETVKHLTCSFGVTGYLNNEKISDLYKRVDMALYTAKRDGRNQVVNL